MADTSRFTWSRSRALALALPLTLALLWGSGACLKIERNAAPAADTGAADDAVGSSDTTGTQDTASADSGTAPDVATCTCGDGTCAAGCEDPASCPADCGGPPGDCRTWTPPQVCDDGLACTTDSCGPDGECDFEPDGGHCLIDGACHASGATPTGEPCQRCDPAAQPMAWSAVTGGACDDGDACTTGDTCAAGACVGTAKGCDDGLACTADSCAGGACKHAVKDESCLIGGVCRAAGATGDEAGCLTCQPMVDAEAWSVALGPCDDGDDCTDGDTCSADGCAGEPATDAYEPNDAEEDAAYLGQAFEGDAFPKGTIDARALGYEYDYYSFEVVDKAALGAPHPRIEVVGISPGRTWSVELSYECAGGVEDTQVKCVTAGAEEYNGTFIHSCVVYEAAGTQELELVPTCSGIAAKAHGTATVEILTNPPIGFCDAYQMRWGVE